MAKASLALYGWCLASGYGCCSCEAPTCVGLPGHEVSMLPDLRLTLTGALVLLIGACAGDSAAPDPAPEPPAILTAQLPTEGADSLSTLVSCRTQPVPATSKYIGSKGGDLWIGPHHLIVPQGALKTTVRITGAVVDTNVVAVELQPAGLQLPDARAPHARLRGLQPLGQREFAAPGICGAGGLDAEGGNAPSSRPRYRR